LCFGRYIRCCYYIGIFYFALQYPVFGILYLFNISCRNINYHSLPCKRKQWLQYIVLQIGRELFYLVQKKGFRYIRMMNKREREFADAVKPVGVRYPLHVPVLCNVYAVNG